VSVRTSEERVAEAGAGPVDPWGRWMVPNYAPAPVTLVSGSGAWVKDDRGREHLDFLSGIAVTSLGHCHPTVSAALVAQAGQLWHVSNLFRNALAPEVAERVDWMVGEGRGAGGKVFFANSGAEANECAIKLARRAAGPGRHVVVAALGSFHGRTLATLAATGQPAKHQKFLPLPPGFRHVPFGDASLLAGALGPDVGAVLLEPIQGEGGVVVPPEGYLRDVRMACDEAGVLLIVDEVQSGMARTGRWLGVHHDGVRPDIVTMAKALANGLPTGACWASEEVASAFEPGDHGSTFGGQPLAMAAAKATIDAMVAMDAPARAAEAGARLQAAVGSLAGVAAVRGRGLLLGCVLEGELAGKASAVARAALEEGLLLNALLPDVLRLAPPLVISDDELEEGTRRLARSIERVVAAEVRA
jgi:acetylornithine/N-succinyldiaminopimelate aminotransferase